MFKLSALVDSRRAMLVPSVVLLALILICHRLPESQANDSSLSDLSPFVENELTEHSEMDCNDNNFCPGQDYGAHSAYVPCSHLPLDFIDCDDLIDHQGNVTSLEQSGNLGCLKFGGQNSKDVYMGSRYCHVIKDIECYGNKSFIRYGFPCLRYNGHYFVTTLLFSLLLGFLGMDRFYLGHTGTAIGKMLTIGGVGIWWIVDIILLITGNLMPEDGSNWMPYA